MSYILDALKNSQDSRSRGAVPDIASQMAIARSGPTRRERIWRLLVLATVLVLLAVLGWQRWLAPSPGERLLAPPLAEQPVSNAQASSVPSVAVQPPAAPASEVVASAADGITAAPTAVLAPAAPVAPVSAEPAAPASSQAPGLAALQQLAGVRVNVDEPKPPSLPVPVAAPAGPPPIVQKLELPVERPPVVAPAARQPPLVPALPTSQAAPTPQIAEYGEVEHWKQLPAQIQQQLRETPFNVHIYASDPKLRFVKSNGRTLREGDEINSDLRMLHITRDGVIVGYKGGKYWMRLS